MSGSPLYYIQKAIYDTLTNDADIQALVGTRIYDHTPDNTIFPYITIGESISSNYSTFESFGQEVHETMHVWSRYLGYLEIEQILDAIASLFGNKFIPLDDEWCDVGCWFESTNMFVESDGITRHAVTRYKFKVLERPEEV